MIMADSRIIHLGVFDTPEAAHSAYCAAAVQHHGAFAGIPERERCIFTTLLYGELATGIC